MTKQYIKLIRNSTCVINIQSYGNSIYLNYLAAKNDVYKIVDYTDNEYVVQVIDDFSETHLMYVYYGDVELIEISDELDDLDVTIYKTTDTGFTRIDKIIIINEESNIEISNFLEMFPQHLFKFFSHNNSYYFSYDEAINGKKLPD